jgi:hypothetical protein
MKQYWYWFMNIKINLVDAEQPVWVFFQGINKIFFFRMTMSSITCNDIAGKF